MEAEVDTRDVVLRAGAKLSHEGSVDVRNEDKRMLAVLVDEPRFLQTCERAVKDKADLKDLKKAVKQVKEDKAKGGNKGKKK